MMQHLVHQTIFSDQNKLTLNFIFNGRARLKCLLFVETTPMEWETASWPDMSWRRTEVNPLCKLSHLTILSLPNDPIKFITIYVHVLDSQCDEARPRGNSSRKTDVSQLTIRFSG